VGEECDDGNTVAGDGCSEICIVPEPGQTAMLVSGIVLLLWLGRRSHR
jgi:cysteine-rich repeat protein